MQCVDVKSKALQVVSDHLCTGSKKPQANKFCNKQPCPFVWEVGDWSPVSYKWAALTVEIVAHQCLDNKSD